MRVPTLVRDNDTVLVVWRHALPACERERMGYHCHRLLLGGCEYCGRGRPVKARLKAVINKLNKKEN